MLWNNELLKASLKDEIIFMDKNTNFCIEAVGFDNRRLQNNSLFIARKGEKNDGHSFIKATLDNNLNCFVLAEYVLEKDLEKHPRIILVKNTLRAMELMAIYRRSELKGKVIGITGSLGKTSTKEMAFAVLSKFGKTYCNQQSFNNHIGLLITMINTPSTVDYCIYELGMSAKGELAELVNFAQPELSIITNVESAHIEFFKNEEEIAEEKGNIFLKTKELAILNLDNRHFNFLQAKAKKNNVQKLLTFGTDKNADICLEKQEIRNQKLFLEIKINNEIFTINYNNLDCAFAFNSLSIIAIVYYLKLDINQALQCLAQENTPRGRNNIEEISYKFNNKNINFTLINGTYNGVNPKTFINGLTLLNDIYYNSIHKFNKKFCIFGDILEAGAKTEEFHLSLKEYIVKYKIDVLITIGENMRLLHNSLKDFPTIKLKHFNSADECISEIKNLIESEDLVFIKSSKGIKTWKIAEYLSGISMNLFI